MFRKNGLKNFVAILLVLILLTAFPLSAFARTLDDIQNDIDQMEGELDSITQELDAAQSSLNSSQSKKNSAHGKLQELEAEIQLIADQLEYNKIKIDVLEKSRKLKELEKEEREEKQDVQITAAYLSWKSAEDDLASVMFNSENPVRTATYYNLITGNEQKSIETLAVELNEIEQQYTDFKQESDTLTNDITRLTEEREAKLAEIEAINATIAAESSRLAAAQSQVNQAQAQIDQLYDEQKALQEYEAWLLGQNGNGGTQPIVSGEYYFTGRGRDVVQGHGIGLSQNGALGAALAGWTAQQIIQFYYPGATVATYTARTVIPVQGHGDMDINTYAAGLGEVPSYGCENLGVNFGDLGYWGCWPDEAVKAQVIAARSYALTYTAGGSAICTTAACQVYQGGEAKRWAADETSYQAAVIGGQPIKAYYSAQNNQGAGTANNDTVWANREGNGTPISYLRSANDNGFYYPASYSGCGGGDCAVWGYRTNSYTIAQIQSMLEWSITSPSTSITQGDRDFISGIMSNIGSITSITFERDPSQRVNKVVVTGPGGSRKMGGWFFKSLWNIWVSYVKPSGEEDYIYSLTFFMLQG